MEFLHNLSYWHWIILALILLAGEALGAAGFMIGISLSALAVAGLMAVGVLHDWQYQFLLFALLSVVASVLFWQFFHSREHHDNAVMINDRAAQLVGRKLTLTTDMDNGEGKVQIGDTLWKISAEADYAEGTRVEVVGAKNMTLEVRKV